MSEQRNNSGALFKNTKKETDKHPDYTGSIVVDDKEYWISGWNNTAKSSGTKYMGLSVTLKEPKTQMVEENTPAMSDEDIPF
tara:strand:+ start:641 stop:886 length:246 start_codon:yes stop_codon:yes gene_type:complete